MTKPHFFLFPPHPSSLSLSCLLKGTAWHFKSLLFCLSRHLLHWGFCPWGTLWIFLSFFFFSYMHWNHCKGAHIKLVILHLFIWTFSFHCSQCSLNVKLDFCQTEDSTLYLILLKHLVPEFHIEETWIPPTVKVWIGLCICIFLVWTHYIFFKAILSNS